MPQPRIPIVFAAAISLLLLGSRDSRTQERQVPNSVHQLELSFAPIVKRVAPAVVNVYAARVVENNNPFLTDPFFRQFFGTVPREQVERSLGSGVIVDPAGLVVTNYHVISGASQVKVALADKRDDYEVALRICDDAVIHELNREWRAKDKPTDVLAFSQLEGALGAGAGPLLGDVIVSIPTAQRQARVRRADLTSELTTLLAHGLLHLVGWDHDTAAKDRQMRRETARLCAYADGVSVRARRKEITK